MLDLPYFLHSLSFNQLTIPHSCINFSPLHMIKPIFKKIFSSQILFFLVFLLIHLNILI